MALTLIECIARMMRTNALIRGDTDAPTSLSDTQHNASINIALVAVQNELTRLVAERLIPKERLTSGSITLATNTAVYNLATGFVRFYGVPHLYNSTQNRQLYEYPGGLPKLQVEIYNYATQYGQPNWWYWAPGNTAAKQIGFFLVPSSGENGQVWTYDYEGSVMVSAATDELPFHNDEENFTFTELAARRFKFMWDDVQNQADIQAILDRDMSYRTANKTLYKLLRGENPSRGYGHTYR